MVKLHTKLGKPIPSTDPVVVPAVPDKPSAPAASMKNPVAGTAKKLVATPKITFVGEGGGAKLTMGGGVKTEEKAEAKVEDDDGKGWRTCFMHYQTICHLQRFAGYISG